MIVDAFSRTAFTGLILSLILAGPALLAVELIFHTNFSLLMVLSTLVLLVIALLGIAAFFYRKLWRQIGTSVSIFADRLVYQRKGAKVDYRWEDIREFYCHSVDEYRSVVGLDQTYSESRDRYRFTHANDHQFEFAERFSRNQLVPVADYVEQGLLETQLPGMRARLQQGNEPICFGPLTLEAQGIQYGRSLLPWEQVDFVGAEGGKLLVRKKDKTFSWCSVRADKVPNCCLFLALAKEKHSQSSSPP